MLSALGLVAVAFFTSGFIPRERLAVPLGFGRLDGADLALMGVVAIALLRGLLRGQLPIRWWAVAAPAFVYLGWMGLAALYALLHEGVSPNLVIGELRPALYCAGCLVAASALERREQLTVLLVGLFLVADLTAAVVVAQQFIGGDARLLEVMTSGSWQINEQHAADAFGSTRIVPPGHFLLFLMSIVAFCRLLEPGNSPWVRLLLIGQLGFLNVGLLLTYTRAQWLASGIALAMAFVLMPRDQKARLGGALLRAAPLGLLAVAGLIVAPVGSLPMLEALADRAGSIARPDETLTSASLEWRQFENDAARDAIEASPVVGAGLGNDYRPITLVQGEARGWLWRLDGEGRLTRFIHNSYLYIAVKAGLVAVALFAWMAIALLVSGVAWYRRAPDAPGKSLLLPVLCSFAGLLEWSFFEAHLMLTPSLAMLGLAVGLVGAAAAIDGRAAERRAPAAPVRGWVVGASRVSA